MNIYKFYFNHLIEAVEKFKSDFKYSFIVEDILKKLTLEPPKNSINGDYEKFNELLKITSKPYDYLEKTKLQKTPVGFDDSYKTFCGT